MTDKQIIIDGVDVSRCIFHSLTTMGYAGYNYCKCFECACECHNDCHYKQLKRKEEECEELKGKLKYVRDENVHLKESANDEQMDFLALNNYIKTLEFQLNQLKAEMKKSGR